MDKKLNTYAAPLIILPVFLFAFHYVPGVKEGHHNMLVLASVLTPLLVVILAEVSLRAAIMHSIALQLFYILYGAWYWKQQDALTDHFFSFENELSVGFLIALFVGSLLLAILIRNAVDRIGDISKGS